MGGSLVDGHDLVDTPFNCIPLIIPLILASDGKFFVFFVDSVNSVNSINSTYGSFIFYIWELFYFLQMGAFLFSTYGSFFIFYIWELFYDEYSHMFCFKYNPICIHMGIFPYAFIWEYSHMS